MSIQSIHSREHSTTTFASERSVIGMQLLVAFTIVLSRKALATTRPMTNKGLLFVVRSDVT